MCVALAEIVLGQDPEQFHPLAETGVTFTQKSCIQDSIYVYAEFGFQKCLR